MNYRQIFDLDGKVALITGASKGIGEAIARIFVAYGAKVVLSSRKQADLDAVAADIGRQGGQCAAIAANAGNMADCARLIEKTAATFGSLHILVNNAATNPVFGPLLNMEEWAFDKIMAVNVKGPFALANLAHPYIKQSGGGSIVNISSVAGETPDPGLGIYSISKAALNMLTKVQAREWGPDGIRVNAISPGLVKTKFSQALWTNEEVLERWVKNIPLPRMGTVEEIAALALYLVSSASGYCTGAIFTADGGMTI
jgi:dehydrogenase/reductase SDR family protein 4